MFDFLNRLYIVLSMQVNNFLEEEKGAVDLITIVVLIGIAIVLAVVFRDKMKEILMDCIKRKTLGAFQEKKPLSFLFAGVTGTGKSETAKIIAKSIFGNEDSLITVNIYIYI